ncbi:MAG: M50 family metallopeptidase, partial [Eubacterium sp.]|nr:M50 family metallopeptidase [Eubacterium sp.]
VAKYNKIGVIEFSLGMGPRIISWGKTKNGYKIFFFKSTSYFEKNPLTDQVAETTLYSWKLLPLGGSCMMLGEEDASVEDERAFGKKSVYARMAVIFAGPLFNFILAFLLSIIVIACVGYDPAKVTEVAPGSGAEAAGLQVGDTITEINGENIVINREVSYYTIFHTLDENPVVVKVNRQGVDQTLTIQPKLETDSVGNSRYRMGFSHASKREKVGFGATLKYSLYEVKFWIQTTVKSLGMMIRGRVSKDDISGPVGIVQTMGKTVEESKPEGVGIVTINLLMISILLSANLGVMNLIPIPALDGGRLFFLLIEWIRRKPLPEKVETYVNAGGFMLLMGLMIFIMANDVTKFFR